MPWGLNERLWPIKYIIFLGLFGLSLYSVGWPSGGRGGAIQDGDHAQVHARLAVRPLAGGAARHGAVRRAVLLPLSLPAGRGAGDPGADADVRLAEAAPECGSPCQRCAKECPVQAIHPEGHINPNECIWCMHCQDLYWDDHRCPAMIQKRLKREGAKRARRPTRRRRDQA